MAKQPSYSQLADDPLIIVKTMLSSSKDAKHLAKTLVKEHLVACAQVVPGVTSFFHWGGRLTSAREYMVLMKTKRRRYPELEARILSLHSYESPEIVAWEATIVPTSYLAWVEAEV